MHEADPKHNALLNALPTTAYAPLLPHLQLTQLALGHSLYESGEQMQYVYFPVDSIVSLLYTTKDGASAEIAMAGPEGMIGVALFMGGDSTPDRAAVQSAGRAYRLRAAVLKNEFKENLALRELLLRYTQALFTQMAQTAVCNRHHSVRQQLCRMLLSVRDRAPSDELHLTHETIAGMLGVRRESISQAAKDLQDTGLINYQHGRVSVRDRVALEAAACECYSVVKREYCRLLHRPGNALRGNNTHGGKRCKP